MFNRIQGGVGRAKWIAFVLHHTPTMKKWIKWREVKTILQSALVTLVQLQSWQSWSLRFSELGDFWWIAFLYQLWCDDTGDNLKDINGNQAIRHQKSPILMNHLPEAGSQWRVNWNSAGEQIVSLYNCFSTLCSSKCATVQSITAPENIVHVSSQSRAFNLFDCCGALLRAKHIIRLQCGIVSCSTNLWHCWPCFVATLELF